MQNLNANCSSTQDSLCVYWSVLPSSGQDRCSPSSLPLTAATLHVKNTYWFSLIALSTFYSPAVWTVRNFSSNNNKIIYFYLLKKDYYQNKRKKAKQAAILKVKWLLCIDPAFSDFSSFLSFFYVVGVYQGHTRQEQISSKCKGNLANCASDSDSKLQ